jgi:hypothetical protein
LFALAAAACGKVGNNGNDMGGGGTGGTGGGGDGGAGASCTAGQMCTTVVGDGLCTGGACAPCTDVSGDPACAAVYGTGALCIAGACVIGQCRDSSQCGGSPCVEGACVGSCIGDEDCAGTPGSVCNTQTGACVANAACSGTACSVNASDKCCAGATTCTANIACCADADCGASEVCTAGQCVDSACGTHTGSTYYVDPASAAANPNGTTACPFKTIRGALTAIGTSTATIQVAATYNEMATAGRDINSNITILGANAVEDPTMWPTVTVDATHDGFNFKSGGRLAYFNVKGQKANNYYGITVNNNGVGAVTIDHVNVTNFDHGINVSPNGSAIIKDNVASNGNVTGLYVGQGGSAIIGFTDATKTKTTFNTNDNYGIYVAQSAAFSMTGPAVSPPIVGARSNLGWGLRYSSTSAGTITNCAFSSNANAGIYVYADSKLKVRGSNFENSMTNGVYVADNNGDKDVSGIDFGNHSSAGNNSFIDNAQVAICLGTQPDNTSVYPNDLLLAVGNTIGTIDCATTNANVGFSSQCLGNGVGYKFGSVDDPYAIDLSSCGYIVK